MYVYLGCFAPERFLSGSCCDVCCLLVTCALLISSPCRREEMQPDITVAPGLPFHLSKREMR